MVTLTVDRAWLTDAARVWPVLVDPTVDLTGSAAPDCNVESDLPTTASAVTDTYTTGHGAIPGQHRACFRCDELTNVIPHDDAVSVAHFALHVAGPSQAPAVA